MAGEKRFRTSFFGGFNKADVNAYIEKILREIENIYKEKDNEIAQLKDQYDKLRVKYDELSQKAADLERERGKIAEALIKAQEKAENIIENAKIQAEEERRSIENIIEREKEKLVDLRHSLKSVQNEVYNVLKGYNEKLEAIIDQGIGKVLPDESYQEEVAATESDSIQE